MPKRKHTKKKGKSFNKDKKANNNSRKRGRTRVRARAKQNGGNPESVKSIMINNLCKSTKNGENLKNKDSASYVHIQNLCSTSEYNSNNNLFNNIGNNEDFSSSESRSKSFLEGGFINTVFKLATMPLSIASSGLKKVTGIDLENTVKEKVFNKTFGGESNLISKSNSVEDRIEKNLEKKLGGGKNKN